MTEISSKSRANMNTRVQEGQMSPIRINSYKTPAKSMIIKLSKFESKERILKAVRGKKLIREKKSSHSKKASSVFLGSILKDRREEDNIIKMLKGKKNANQEYFTWQSCPSEIKRR